MRRSLSRFAWLERIPETDATSFLTGISAASHHISLQQQATVLQQQATVD
jgi:hypothetical protein